MIHAVRLDKDHCYWIPDGTSESGSRQVPGFSEIVKALGICPENPFYTASGRERGIALHLYLQFMVKGGNPAAPDPRIADKVEGIRRFIRDTGFKIVGGEEPRYCPASGYACTPDLWGFIGNWSWVIDMKSGAKQPYHALQTAAQLVALKANGFRAQKRGALYLKNKGYRLVEHDNPQDIPVWLNHAHRYHNLKKEAA